MKKEKFATIGVDLTEDERNLLVMNFLKSKLDEDSLYLLKSEITDIKLYHAILSNELKLLTTTFNHPDDIILFFLQKHLSPASFSLYKKKYELHSQLFELLLNEQLVILLTEYVNSNKEVN